MTVLKLTQLGDSVAVILPKEMLARLRVDVGDTLYVTATEGGITLTPHDPAVTEEVERGREFMREFRDTFGALAK